MTGLLACLLLVSQFTLLDPPELTALRHADLLSVNLVDPADDLTAPVSPEAAGRWDPTRADSPPTSGKPIELPFPDVRTQGMGLATFVYAIALDNRNLGPLTASVDSDATRFGNAYGLLFIQVINGGDFYLNGHWVAGLTASSRTERWMWFKPFIVPLPSRLLHRDGRPNVLVVSQSSHEPNISIPRPYFGTLHELSRVASMAFFFGSTLSNAFGVLCLVAGLFLLGAWMVSPKSPIYAWGGSAGVLWAVLFMLLRWHYTSTDMRGVWRWTVYVCESGLVTLMVLSMYAFIGKPIGRISGAALIFLAGLAPLVYAVGGIATEQTLDLVWTPAIVMLYVYAIGHLIGFCLVKRSKAACIFLGQSLVFLMLALHDYAVQSGLINQLGDVGLDTGWIGLFYEQIFFAPLAMPMLILFVGYILLRQHQRNIRALAASSAHLANTLHHRETELGEVHEKMKIIARSEAILSERERIYQDLHDGVGSQLVKAIFSLRTRGAGHVEVEHTLQACLQDLRLIIESQAESTMDLQNTVFAFCLTQEGHLEGSGLNIQYSVGNESTMYTDPRVNLNVLRVLQESLSNTIKHSGADLILVEIHLSDRDLLLSITDNGRRGSLRHLRGQPSPYGTSGGKGIPGLASRAADIGATYTIDMTESGTRVCLSIPLPEPAAPGESLQAAKQLPAVLTVPGPLHMPLHPA